MEKLILHGRTVAEGCAEAEAVVCKGYISGWGGIDPRRGTFIDVRETSTYGKSFKVKVLIFQGAKGSSGWSTQFHEARMMGNAPAAIIFNITTTKSALGTIICHVPAVTGLDQDPTEVICNGDLVKVDGTNGIVEVTRREKQLE